MKFRGTAKRPNLVIWLTETVNKIFIRSEIPRGQAPAWRRYSKLHGKCEFNYSEIWLISRPRDNKVSLLQPGHFLQLIRWVILAFILFIFMINFFLFLSIHSPMCECILECWYSHWHENKRNLWYLLNSELLQIIFQVNFPFDETMWNRAFVNMSSFIWYRIVLFQNQLVVQYLIFGCEIDRYYLLQEIKITNFHCK